MNKTRFELVERVKKNFKKYGFVHVFRILCEYIYHKYIIPPKTFIFENYSYPYFYHWYNTTWKNPRAIEVPIVLKIVKEYRGKKILEVGNVLSHYVYFKHDILDKYEIAPGVINEDIVNFKPVKKYDLVVSISTLEHVGFDEPLKSKVKFSLAITNLKKCLKKGGKIVFTVPLGYNTDMERCLISDKSPSSEYFYLKQIQGEDTKWIEIKLKLKELIKHNFHEDVLLIGIIKK